MTNLHLDPFKVFVFDFDGVLCDSIYETLVLNWIIKNDLSADCIATEINIDSAWKDAFLTHRHLVGPANEYYFLMQAMDRLQSGFCKDVPSEFHQLRAIPSRTSQEHAEKLFSLRLKLKKERKEDWLKLLPFYAGMGASLKTLAEQAQVFISSTKDESTIREALAAQGLEDTVSEVYGKDRGVDKVLHIEGILTETGASPEELFFIDDNWEHLKATRDKVGGSFLALWGYTHPQAKDFVQEFGGRAISRADFVAGVEQTVS